MGCGSSRSSRIESDAAHRRDFRVCDHPTPSVASRNGNSIKINNSNKQSGSMNTLQVRKVSVEPSKGMSEESVIPFIKTVHQDLVSIRLIYRAVKYS